MTLHEAIVHLLKQSGSMPVADIANRLNKNKLYVKKDGSEIRNSQIHARVNKYPNLFEKQDSVVSLKSQTNFSNRKKAKSNKVSKTSIQSLRKATIKKSKKTKNSTDSKEIVGFEDLENGLMDEKNFKNAGLIDNLVPDKSGLYCVRVTDIYKLPIPFKTELKKRKHNIIYIGIASKILKIRFLNQELRANGHGTFFRSVGAMLGYKPAKGSLATKKNKRNYKFKRVDEQKIIKWINANLKVNWIPYKEDINNVEKKLIKKYLPLLNIQNNPKPFKELRGLRAECVKIANRPNNDTDYQKNEMPAWEKQYLEDVQSAKHRLKKEIGWVTLIVVVLSLIGKCSS